MVATHRAVESRDTRYIVYSNVCYEPSPALFEAVRRCIQ